jgi:hypothetical protein
MFIPPTRMPAHTVKAKKPGDSETEAGTPTRRTANGKAKPITTPNPIIETARLVKAFLEMRMRFLSGIGVVGGYL